MGRTLEELGKGQRIMMTAVRERFGFLTTEEVAQIAADPETRLEWLLVRCGGGRFVAPAQDIAHFIGIIEREAGDGPVLDGESDYVRDVSVPAGWTSGKGGLSFDPLKGVANG